MIKSRPLLDKTIPATPPIVNRNKKPTTHNVVQRMWFGLSNILKSQLNTLIPVGIPTINVDAMK